MSGNKQQFETDFVINDKSQSTVAKHLRYCGILNNSLLQSHYWVCLWKNYKISQHLAKLHARKLIVSCTLCTWAVSCWKMKNLPVWQETAVDNCCYKDFDNYHISQGSLYRWLQFSVDESCVTVCSRSSWAMILAVSWTHISQDRVTTYLKCGDIFNSHFTANLLLNQTVKESINSWWTYCLEFGGLLFLECRIHAALQTCILCFVIADRWCHIAVCLLYEWLSLGTFVSQ